MNSRLMTITMTLRIAFGLMAALAGLDKFFNLLADWESYIAPAAAHLAPMSPGTLMGIVGVTEMAVGLTILFVEPGLGAYVASAWLVLVAVNLILGGHYDIAVRDVVLSVSACALASLSELTAEAPAHRMSLTTEFTHTK